MNKDKEVTKKQMKLIQKLRKKNRSDLKNTILMKREKEEIIENKEA